jgi:hypothetical protein
MRTQQNPISLHDTLQGYQEWLKTQIQNMQSLAQEIRNNSSLLDEAIGLERCIEDSYPSHQKPFQ